MFCNTSDLKDQEIYLQLSNTCDENKEKQWVPAYYFDICFHDGTVIGTCDLRIGYNQNTYIGGNIGYQIYEEYRGHNYALKACRLLFKQAIKHNMKYIIITCNPTNIASYKTIEKAGGKLLGIEIIPKSHDLYALGRRYSKVYKIDFLIHNKVRFYEYISDELLKFAVIVTQYQGKWLFCRHKDRKTWEIPGGKRKLQEDILDTAKRELKEETSAMLYKIQPICVYSVQGKTKYNRENEESYGMLYYANIETMSNHLEHEIEEIKLYDQLPQEWTYLDIQPYLLQEVIKRIEKNKIFCS